MKLLLHRLLGFDAHHRVGVSQAVAVLVFGIARQWVLFPLSLIFAWDGFALCSLAIAWGGTVGGRRSPLVHRALGSNRRGAVVFVNLTARVPDPAPYGSKHILDISNLKINEGAVAGRDDDGIHVAAFLGDATGNQSYSGLSEQVPFYDSSC